MKLTSLFPKSSPLLKIKDFRKILQTRILMTMALQIQAVAVGWHVYSLTKDPLLLGLIGLTEAVPAILGAFISGHIVDQSKPALVFRNCLIALFLNFLFLFSLIETSDLISNQMIIIGLFISVFISGAARSFISPSIFSLMPQIVPRDLFSSAAAFNSSTYQLASVAGPALGGLLYGSLGPKAAFLAPCLLSFLSLLIPSSISSHIKEYMANNTREPFLTSITKGIRFSFQHEILFSAMTLDMFSVLFGGAVAVLPMFADQVFHVGPSGLGVLRAAPAIGSGIVSLTLALYPLKNMSGKQLLVVVAGFGLCTIAFGLCSNYILAIVLLALSGAFDGISMVIRGTILQLYTPNEMRGRVSAVNSVFITSSNEIGAFESGLAAKVMGLIPSVVFGGVMTLAVVGAVMVKFPKLIKTKIDYNNPAT